MNASSELSQVPAKKMRLTEESKENFKKLTLYSPGKKSLTYNYPSKELVQVLILTLEESDVLRAIVNRFMIDSTLDTLYDASYETLEKIVKVFNKARKTERQLWDGQTKPGEIDYFTQASTTFLRRIIDHCYVKVIPDQKKLNHHYGAFSSETYGETLFHRMQSIIEEIKPTKNDVFVDMGSGVGQLVLQMSGATQVKKSVGIEISDLPAQCAERFQDEFKKLMYYFGKRMSPFVLEKGNFLDDDYCDLITNEATIIFINNYVFDAMLNHKIKRLLSKAQEGTRIITTKPFASLDYEINERNLDDFSSMVDVRLLKECKNPVSWTSKDVPYYLHTITLAKRESYFNKLFASPTK